MLKQKSKKKTEKAKTKYREEWNYISYFLKNENRKSKDSLANAIVILIVNDDDVENDAKGKKKHVYKFRRSIKN